VDDIVERRLAACVERDLDAAAKHSDTMPDWVRETMRDGAEAIRRLSSLVEAVECEPMHPDEEGWSEWIHPLPGYLMQCCDCGLTHEMEFAIGARADDGPLNEGESDAAVILFRARRHGESSHG
jgi:hypothetical protein